MTSIIFILFIHWVADFALQSHYVAVNKSQNVNILLYHVSLYSIILFICFGWQFAVINGLAHLITDFFTSKLTTKLWAEGEIHNFFVVIGFDQFLHTAALMLSFMWCMENDMMSLHVLSYLIEYSII